MHRETKIKLIGTGIFITLILGIIYLTYYTNQIKEELVIESVRVTGNRLLTENDYLSFVKLNELQNYKNMNLPLIKSRFEKHPYISKAEVKFINEKQVKVFLTEKSIYGVIIKSGEPLLAAEDFQILPVFPNTKMINIPVFSNVEGSNELKPLMKKKNEDILQAYKIIDASGLTNTGLLKDLAGINLRNGGDVVLTFSGLSFPVIFGRNKEAQKIVSLEALLDNNIINECDYIDLRFYNDIYIGHSQRVEL